MVVGPTVAVGEISVVGREAIFPCLSKNGKANSCIFTIVFEPEGGVSKNSNPWLGV
jgi:hypothetical protein